MTYQDLINELQTLSFEELNQPVHYCVTSPEELTEDTPISLEEVDYMVVDVQGEVCLSL